MANLLELITSTKISQVWVALGGDQPRLGRAKAFYRSGDNPSAVALDDDRGVWFDHRDGKGGGILDLIQYVRACTRSEAAQWLADFCGVQPDDYAWTPEQRREIARRRERAEREARDIEHWRSAYAVELNMRKVEAVRVGDDDALGRAAALCHVLENGPVEQIVREFRRHRDSDPADVARLMAIQVTAK